MKAIVNSMALIFAALVFGNAAAQENSYLPKYQQAYQGAPVNSVEERDGPVRKDSQERIVRERRDKSLAKPLIKQKDAERGNKKRARTKRYCRNVTQKDGKVIRKCSSYRSKKAPYIPD
jgi:hypothetical protein